MASMAGCTLCASSSASMELLTSLPTTTSRPLPSKISAGFAQRNACNGRTSANGRKLVASSSKSSFSGEQLSICSSEGRRGRIGGLVKKPRVVVVRGYTSSNDVVGEDPDWSESDYIVVGLAHCFKKDEEQKLHDAFVIEPIPAGGLECMENGGVTCYKHATGSTLGVVLKQDASLLPKEFASAPFCEGFDFRTKCASRTWKRDHPRENLMNLVPRDGRVRSDWNFSLQDKRVLNQENIVKDSDNIKQDLSIDVYGRTEQEEEMTAEIGQLYNV